MSVVTPAASATGTSSGESAWTWLSTAPGVAIKPYAVNGCVCGPMGRSMPSPVSRLPARPTPTIRPSLMPMSALTTPIAGSMTTAPVMTTSSSEGPALPPWTIRARRSFA